MIIEPQKRVTENSKEAEFTSQNNPALVGSKELESFRKSHDQRVVSISQPSDDTIVWKYLDLAKYLSLLRSHHLHLAPATEFWDRYEGDIGHVQKKQLIQQYGQERYEQVMQLYRVLRERTYVSCWTENEFESDAMWRIYTGAAYGVAIKSTYGRLKATFDQRKKPSKRMLRYIGRVNYVDFHQTLLDLKSYHLPYFYKRRSFEHEREIRMLMQDTGCIENEGGDLGEKADSLKIQLSREELNEIIISIHLSPGAPIWFRDLVRDLNKDYGLDRDPIPSALDEVPGEDY